MKVYAINGSPRNNKNTATLLDKALEGVRAACVSGSVETERINLYELNYTGCRSCFACKRKDATTNGVCAIYDDLRPVLEKLQTADGIIIGSPIYYRTITAQLHAFYERFLYPYMQYKKGYPTLVTNKMPTACIYTMNVSEQAMIASGYLKNMRQHEVFLESYFQKPLTLHVCNTYQFDDYSKYVCETFTESEKAKYRDEHFPEDCKKAYELGKLLLNR